MKRAATCLVVTWAWVLGGCATLFSGSHQTVTIATAPEAATVIVIGEPAAPLLLLAGRSSAMAQKIVALLAPFLSPAARAELEALTLDELVTRVVMWLRLGQLPPELVAAVPDPVKDELLAFLGVEAAGPAPLRAHLRKGREYALLAYSPGHRVRSASLDSHFNWVTLVNVFDLFLGVPIDMLTGAWMNLGPSHLELTLELRP